MRDMNICLLVWLVVCLVEWVTVLSICLTEEVTICLTRSATICLITWLRERVTAWLFDWLRDFLRLSASLSLTSFHCLFDSFLSDCVFSCKFVDMHWYCSCLFDWMSKWLFVELFERIESEFVWLLIWRLDCN